MAALEQPPAPEALCAMLGSQAYAAWSAGRAAAKLNFRFSEEGRRNFC